MPCMQRTRFSFVLPAAHADASITLPPVSPTLSVSQAASDSADSPSPSSSLADVDTEPDDGDPPSETDAPAVKAKEPPLKPVSCITHRLTSEPVATRVAACTETKSGQHIWRTTGSNGSVRKFTCSRCYRLVEETKRRGFWVARN